MNKEAEKKKDPLWEEHKEESKLFWLEWSWWVCLKWVVNKQHKEHNLVKNDEISEIMRNKAKSHLSNK